MAQTNLSYKVIIMNDMDELPDLFKINTYYKHFALHLNIRSLVAKFDQLKLLMTQFENMGRPLVP